MLIKAFDVKKTAPKAFIGNNNTNLMQWIPGVPAVQTPLGFIGALIAGLAAGYLVKWINTWRIPRSLQAAMPIFFIPLFVGLLLSLIGCHGWIRHGWTC
jgi:PTS system fructose-specific IIC component